MTSSALRLVLALIVPVALAGCGGGDTGTNPDPGGNGGNGGGGGSGGGDRVILDDPSFSTNILEIVDRRGCATSGCHGSAMQASLDLRSSAAYDDLVGVTSTQEPSFVRVVPGDPQNSYLVIKIEGRQNVGSRMPQSGAALDAIDIGNIRNWIANGAQNN